MLVRILPVHFTRHLGNTAEPPAEARFHVSRLHAMPKVFSQRHQTPGCHRYELDDMPLDGREKWHYSSARREVSLEYLVDPFAGYPDAVRCTWFNVCCAISSQHKAFGLHDILGTVSACARGRGRVPLPTTNDESTVKEPVHPGRGPRFRGEEIAWTKPETQE